MVLFHSCNVAFFCCCFLSYRVRELQSHLQQVNWSLATDTASLELTTSSSWLTPLSFWQWVLGLELLTLVDKGSSNQFDWIFFKLKEKNLIVHLLVRKQTELRSLWKKKYSRYLIMQHLKDLRTHWQDDKGVQKGSKVVGTKLALLASKLHFTCSSGDWKPTTAERSRTASFEKLSEKKKTKIWWHQRVTAMMHLLHEKAL